MPIEAHSFVASSTTTEHGTERNIFHRDPETKLSKSRLGIPRTPLALNIFRLQSFR